MPNRRLVGVLSEKAEGIMKYKLVVTKQLSGCKYSIQNIFNNIVLTIYDDKLILELSGGSLYKLCS